MASVQGEENVLPVDSENGSANNWHTDVTFVVNPLQASTLRSIDLPAYGGETLIATSAGAYRDLPAELRNFADTLWAVHTNDYDYSAPKNLEHANAEERRKEFTRLKFETAHPVVRVHPLTGERGLFIGGFAQRLRIVGLSNTESRDIIRLLQADITRPENVVRVDCEPNQLVLFDNRITQHYAPDNYDNQPRKLNRATIAGDFPVGLDGKPSRRSRAIPRPIPRQSLLFPAPSFQGRSDDRRAAAAPERIPDEQRAPRSLVAAAGERQLRRDGRRPLPAPGPDGRTRNLRFDLLRGLTGAARRRPPAPYGTLEPTVLLAAIAAVTGRIGLKATASTTYNDPYNLARGFASVDHISGGRTASRWPM